jgi:hypothetical protein
MKDKMISFLRLCQQGEQTLKAGNRLLKEGLDLQVASHQLSWYSNNRLSPGVMMWDNGEALITQGRERIRDAEHLLKLAKKLFPEGFRVLFNNRSTT